jgi:hypothetical protein
MEARYLYDNREIRGLVSDPLSFGSAARAYVADWMVRLVVDDNIEKKSKPCQDKAKPAEGLSTRNVTKQKRSFSWIQKRPIV